MIVHGHGTWKAQIVESVYPDLRAVPGKVAPIKRAVLSPVHG